MKVVVPVIVVVIHILPEGPLDILIGSFILFNQCIYKVDEHLQDNHGTSKRQTAKELPAHWSGDDLRKSLYGQRIASETILNAVTWFMKDPDPPKPRVLSLLGPTGVGRTYIMKIIARNIYEKGENSKHVHTLIATYQFVYKIEAQFKAWIYGNVPSFPRSMFIFDEMDKMNPHLIETIKPFLDYMPHVDRVSFNNAILIFLSGAGTNMIHKVALDFWRKGKERDELHMNTEGMETKLYQTFFNDKYSGFWHSCLIDEHLVDHFVPFLPLELKHLKQCVLAEMTNMNITHDYDVMDSMLKYMPFFPPEEEAFSIKGCKTIHNKLGLHIRL
ncbi:torsin-1A-like [Triplophysa dalaica]|uniref:torsin-1A-like n=1 Tax=Triplophysa dalaica TaxID=1582913 RepID=UPI0024E02BA0|nr:torsin-1A-like [Triplophysa dalaica]